MASESAGETTAYNTAPEGGWTILVTYPNWVRGG